MSTKKQTIIRTPSDCWWKLESLGGIHPQYDASLVDELCRALELDPSKSMAGQLRAKSVSVEMFLEAFFLAVEPYARMMSDLLTFFEAARAIESSTGVLRVAFDFGHDIQGLQFDLTSFRVWQRHFEQARESAQSDEPAWNHDYMIRLCKIVESTTPVIEDRQTLGAEDATLTNWLRTYRDGTWPEELLPPPDIPLGAPRDGLDVCWDLWLDVVAGSSRVGRRRSQLRAITWQSRAPTEAVPDDDPWVLRLLDSTDWAGRMASALYSVAANADALQSLGDQLGELTGLMPRRAVSLERKIARFESLLSLPLWERRHDLYAAWIGARIAAVAGSLGRVHSIDGVLRYSFAGTHLATFRPAAGATLFLWAELRSPLSSPKGRGRIRAIQPDYSIQREPITYPESSVLVVECKQYLKASPKSFAAALTDYARGRPAAQVLLVNYGPADTAILEKIDTDVRARTSVIGNCRPGSDAALEQFSSLVDSALRLRDAAPMATVRAQGTAEGSSAASAAAKYDPDAATGTPPGNMGPFGGERNLQVRDLELRLEDAAVNAQVHGPAGRAVLTWSASPTDLDLHAWMQRKDGAWEEVSYRSLGSLDSPPWVLLDRDCREGSGPETLTIAQPCVVRCAVHNYSREAPIAHSSAKLQVEIGETSFTIRCPRHGDGSWWDAFEMDLPGRRIRVINSIQGEAPLGAGG